MLTGINEQNVIRVFLTLLKYQNTGRDARTVKDVRRKSYNSIQIIFLLDQVLSDMSFCSSPEKHPMGHYNSHNTAFSKMVQHMLNKGIVSLINNKVLSSCARAAGAPYNKGAGVFVKAKLSDFVEKGDTLMRIHAESKEKLERAKKLLTLKRIFTIQ